MKRRVNRGYRWMEANPATVMLVSLGLGVFATVAVAGVALRGEETRSIVTRESNREQSTADACVPFRKVDRSGRLLRLTKCGVGERRKVQGNSKPVQNLGLGASGGDGGDAPATGIRGATNPRHHSPSAPPSTGSEGTAAPTSPSSAPSSSPSPLPAPSPEDNQGGKGHSDEHGIPVPSLEGVKEKVEEVTKGASEEVGHVVEGVKGTACGLTGGCGP